MLYIYIYTYIFLYFLYKFIFDSICLINNFTFLSYLLLVVGVGRWWWVLVGGGWWWVAVVGGHWRPLEATEASSRAQILARWRESSPPTPPELPKQHLFGEYKEPGGQSVPFTKAYPPKMNSVSLSS